MFENYLDLIQEKIEVIKREESDAIRQAARMVADALMRGNVIFTFGSGHSQIMALEIRARAGGLYPVVEIKDPLQGKAEKIEGVGHILMRGVRMKPGDVFFNISNSGRNPEGIEIGLDAKAMGAAMIVVTSLEHSNAVTSRHSGGKNLYEYADLVLDTHVPLGDASMSYENTDVKAGALSTILGSAIMNAVMVEAVHYMLDAGFEPPVLMSGNLDTSLEHNMAVRARYQDYPYQFDL